MREEESIARVWEHFAPSIVPPDASPDQREKMQTCFYAGGLAVLSLVESLHNAPELVAFFLLHELHIELHAFADARKRAMTTDSNPIHSGQE
jgi:hypothetical protein